MILSVGSYFCPTSHHTPILMLSSAHFQGHQYTSFGMETTQEHMQYSRWGRTRAVNAFFLVSRKVWRYDDNKIAEYSRDRVEQELVALFPTLKSKGSRLEISYKHSLVGIVSIDSDADVQAALTAFAEESKLTYWTLSVEECVKPEVEVQCSKIQKEKSPPKKKRKVSHCN